MLNLAATIPDVIHLSIGQPDYPTPAHILQAYTAALSDGKTRYTMDAGLPELLTALAKSYSAAYGQPMTEDNLLVTCGASEALFLTISGVTTPGSEVIIIEPAFVNYQPLVRYAGGTVVPVITHASDGYQLDVKKLATAITARTRAIILNSPGNPTGVAYPRETIQAVIDLATERGIAIISDEVYERILLDGQPHAGVLGNGNGLENIFFISSASKTYSMPGMRVGWVISSPENIRALRRYHIYTSTVANTPAQWAMVTALTGPQEEVSKMVAGYTGRRDRIMELIKEIPALKSYRPNAAFYLMPTLPAGTNAYDVSMRLLQEAAVCVVPGGTFGTSCNSALRISFANSMQNIEKAFERMTEWFARQSF